MPRRATGAAVACGSPERCPARAVAALPGRHAGGFSRRIRMIQPGSLNALTDIEGITVGNAHDAGLRSGVTVVRLGTGMLCVADVGGGGPVTRETTSVTTNSTLRAAHAVVFSGGSVYGLAAGDAVTHALAAEGIGSAGCRGRRRCPWCRAPPSTISTMAAIKTGIGVTPYPELARQALAACAPQIRHGLVGGRPRRGRRNMRGRARRRLARPWRRHDRRRAGGRRPGRLADHAGRPLPVALAVRGRRRVRRTSPDPRRARRRWGSPADFKGSGGLATTLVVVAVSVPLKRVALKRVAAMARTAWRAPSGRCHAPFDGDTLLAILPRQGRNGRSQPHPCARHHRRRLRGAGDRARRLGGRRRLA